MFKVTIKSDTENYTKSYDELIDAANAFANECGGEEVTNLETEYLSVGAGQEVAEDFEQFGRLVVDIPECNYQATLSFKR